jgi:hypothetical protein
MAQDAIPLRDFGTTDDMPAIHRVYGIDVRSFRRLINLPRSEARHWQVEFARGDEQSFARATAFIPRHRRGRWYQSVRLPDGSIFFRWLGLFDFLAAPDGRRIEVVTYRHASEEGLQAYLLTEALSLAMVQLGREPLHATAVETPHGAVAFIGDSGYGKSTLAALMLAAGCRFITDDMLVLTRHGTAFLACPGPLRIKLYEHVANRIFGTGCNGVPINPATRKLIMPIDASRAAGTSRPVCALYVIEEPGRCGDDIRISPLTPGQALPEILAASLNNWNLDPKRLKRLFRFATDIARTLPVRMLSYPRDEKRMDALFGAVMADLAAHGGAVLAAG